LRKGIYLTGSIPILGKIAIEVLDIWVIALYFVFILGVGIWAGLKRRGETESKGYFLAGGTLTWPLIGMALFSTNISTIHMVGFAEEGYVNGLAHGNFEWMAPFLLIVLALFFAPFYLRSRVATLPDFLEQRYSRGCRNWLVFLSIVSAIFIHICFCLYTGAVVFKGLFGIPIWWSIIAAAALTGIYTIIGGLMAVVVTGALQTIILIGGAIIITVIALHKVGGWEGLAANVEPVKLTVLRSSSDPANLPWYSVFLGYPVIGLWYWCADQTIVQRVLGAKDENHARVGPLFCGFLKILPVFIFFLPGTIYLAMTRRGILEPLSNTKECYAFAITNLLPAGLTGLMAAALLAALMSTVSGALNSIATLFSYDLYKQWKPDTPDRKLVRIGQIATFVGMIIAILSSRYVENFPTIYQGSNAVICYLAPPITAVFLFGVFWRRASSKAALTTLFSGSLLGFSVFLLDINKDYSGWKIPFMMSGFFLFVICSAIMVFASYLEPHKHTEQSEKLVWKSPLESIRWQGWQGIGNYKFLAILLFITMVVLYTIFSTETMERFFGLIK
jgi:SSS family solute:Na+ symporter